MRQSLFLRRPADIHRATQLPFASARDSLEFDMVNITKAAVSRDAGALLRRVSLSLRQCENI